MVALDLLICPACGDRAELRWLAEDAMLGCRECGHRWPFARRPLFALTGPSGAGKSTQGPLLADRLAGEVVVLEQDVLWTAGLRDDVDGHPTFRAAWLRMAAMIGQSGRPVLLCGTVVPDEFENLPHRVLFSEIHYLALLADPETLARRLEARPAWREWTSARIAETVAWANWLRAHADAFAPPVRVLDTAHRTKNEITDEIVAWVRAGLR